MADAAPGPAPTSWHQHRVQALARRAALQQGAVRRLLDDRLRALQGAEGAEAADTVASTASLTRASPLTALLAHITRQGVDADAADGPHEAVNDAANGAANAAANTTTRPRELKALRNYRSTWSRLAVEQRVHQALSRVPPNAGPLNTQRLVHEALSALRDTSPAYLHRLVTQVEALLWLERVGQGGSPGRKPGAGAATAAARPTGSSRS